MKKFITISLVAFGLMISLVSMSFRTITADGEIKLTAAELNSMPFEKLIMSDGTMAVESCVVTVESGNGTKSYDVKWYAQSEELKKYFSAIQPGTKILIQKRVGSDGNGKKKLASLVYVIVDKH